MKILQAPFNHGELKSLRAGEHIQIKGHFLVARDAAHKRLYESIQKGEELPIDLDGECIYYMGPSPAREGEVIGSAGPTTSGRMDIYTPTLLEHGLLAMIGKGYRSDEVVKSMVKHGAVYFVCIGGAGALISQSIKKYEVLAYEDLGAEAIARIEVDYFPCIVAIDSLGNDFYKQGRAKSISS
ncbi:Fe-S-containing hydro-lyase [Helicobacter kayseriensis]|uniref:Fe-S-containing hydro-lyase n=1 Tax=Helicobacter kayseriensis TaxID=2905877 RepID=UPI001E401FA1|nr:Fe-S-containing hydro-lyase [Helicobacter kayseriensis]MCE3047406.1 Fe-S-containing hydro-lyase [Helicobacter kayseriensis]MCE3048923.1 Fe-S-containing hydro-lyase [Helicobacter kayseriensis]